MAKFLGIKLWGREDSPMEQTENHAETNEKEVSRKNVSKARLALREEMRRGIISTDEYSRRLGQTH